MKYRRLNNEELKEMEQEFVRFLVANTITGEDWEKIKSDQPERAEQLIELFSDIVFDKILAKAEFMQFKSKNDIKTFHCLPDKIKMMGVFVEGNTQLDFTQTFAPEQMMSLYSYPMLTSNFTPLRSLTPKKETRNYLKCWRAVA